MGRLQKHLLNAIAIVGALLGSAAQAQSFAEYPEARIDTYPVTGATPAEIFSSISRNAPGTIHAGRPAHAIAFSQFHWRTRSTGRDWCEVELELDLRVTFPAHVDPYGLTGESWDWWNNYSQSLEMHEAGHLQIAANTYPVLLEALESGPCETAAARAKAVLDDLSRRQALYDQITDHGAATSGAFSR